MKFPPQRKIRPPQVSPPRLGGTQGSPPPSQKWGGQDFLSPPTLGGTPPKLAVPSKFAGEISTNVPSKRHFFGGDRLNFDRFPLQTHNPLCPPQKTSFGGDIFKIAWGGQVKFPPQLGGMSPPNFPPTILKNTRFAFRFFFVSPPIGGDVQL